MSEQNKIRWGILGCGKIAHKFASDLALSKTGVLKACAARDYNNARAFAEKYSIRHIYDRYADLAASDEVDIIYIATPHILHYEHTLLCLNHHKNVLCEKPLTINQNLAKHLFDIANQKKLFLMEAMWTAFLPAIIDIKKLILTGAIGDIRYIKADFGFKTMYDPKSRLYDVKLAGGSLLDIGIYPIFITLYLLGYPESIAASGTISQTGSDSECGILLSYPNGAKAALYSTFNCHTDTVCEIFGTNGKIYIPSRFHEQAQYLLTISDEPAKNIATGKIGLGYYHEIEHANECVKSGKLLSDIMPQAMTLNMLSVMDNVRSQMGVTYHGDHDV